MISGGLAGTSVDVALFPIDTIKTRLQSPQGFLAAGGFRGIYQGLGAAAVGSAPGAALFFSVYEHLKPRVLRIQQSIGFGNESTSHMISACCGETAACLVRVPTEVVKGRMQTATDAAKKMGLVDTIKLVLNEKHGTSSFNFTGGLYRGYGITLMREIPFALIQFPLYEKFKILVGDWQQYPSTPVQGAACGSVSGGIAAAITTPLDVLKTRLMLGVDKSGIPYKNAIDVFQRTVSEEGMSALLHGIQPRVMWISIGGFVFFGTYEGFKSFLS
eukprot:CAMPEP_0194141656 /NCGR_PEP_ID=MMETSP0152-20130528/11055_1 /TAXON_ID=1049557 /ORGANISM="Thalassiothrix antarctica, Strain L6-D1" /LENGTH=272 /DNA_ID=CAMNT_0038840353 /DNA_START=60 /DNA_END=878 /DNA_ORIENTATION=+